MDDVQSVPGARVLTKGRQLVRARKINHFAEVCGREMCLVSGDVAEVGEHGLGRRGRCLSSVGCIQSAAGLFLGSGTAIL